MNLRSAMLVLLLVTTGCAHTYRSSLVTDKSQRAVVRVPHKTPASNRAISEVHLIVPGNKTPEHLNSLGRRTVQYVKTSLPFLPTGPGIFLAQLFRDHDNYIVPAGPSALRITPLLNTAIGASYYDANGALRHTGSTLFNTDGEPFDVWMDLAPGSVYELQHTSWLGDKRNSGSVHLYQGK